MEEAKQLLEPRLMLVFTLPRFEADAIWGLPRKSPCSSVDNKSATSASNFDAVAAVIDRDVQPQCSTHLKNFNARA